MTPYLFHIIVTLCLYSNARGEIYVNEDPNQSRDNRIEDVYIRFYNGSSIGFFVTFPLSEAISIFNINGFQIHNPTVIYAHGFTESAERESVKTIATAYLETKPGTNFVLIDWSNMNQDNYVTNAAMNTKPVGLAVAAQINSLVNGGLPLTNVHLVGHSLGGHVVGYAARQLKNTYQKTLKRVTAIDPAFPNFYPDGALMEHIRASDAEFVDVIHTDAGGYGAPVSTGTADFWPNRGSAIQPGCPIAVPLTNNSYCSHGRSWRFFAESVRTPYAFPASPANGFIQFKLNPTPEVGMVYMGYNCSSNARGDYYLTTNSASPYGKGRSGLN